MTIIDFVDFSPSGDRLISISRDGMLRLWDTASGQTLYTMQGISRTVWSPDGKVFAGLDEVNLQWLLFDAEKRAIIQQIPFYSVTDRDWNAPIGGFIIWSPDGQKFAHVIEGVTTIWKR